MAKSEVRVETRKQVYSFPTLDQSVEAESLEEALSLIKS